MFPCKAVSSRYTDGICSIGNGTEHSAKVEVSGGEIRAGIFGFGTNGSNGNGGVDFVMTGGTITSVAEDAPALYLPAYYSTATITGGTITRRGYRYRDSRR